MSSGRGYALVIISLIIGSSGFGMGIYAAISYNIIQGPPGEHGADGVDGIDGVDGVNGTINNVVGIWDEIEGGSAIDFYLEFGDPLVVESEFLYLTDGNTSVVLTEPGWYRFSIHFSWNSLTGSNVYIAALHKNGVVRHHLIYLSGITTNSYNVNKFAYVYSDGNDVFRIRCYDNLGTDASIISGVHTYNQFVVEYVKEG